jgi:S-(hydroxymethyl)glutathione dehydrogenase / alcohol dehydrogenase
MKAQAAIANGNGGFLIDEITVGHPKSDEVLVQLKASGVCHTDWKSLVWGKKLVMGHEGAGIVQEVGRNVKHVSPGDHVLLTWAIACGKCFSCKSKEFVLCEKYSPVVGLEHRGGHAHFEGTRWKNQPIQRSFSIGTMATLTLVRKESVVKLDKKIPFASACIVGCGVMTGFGSAVNAAKIKRGSSVVIIGCGGVGLNVIQGARVCGARKIIAIDLKNSRLQTAKKFGATHGVIATRNDPHLIKTARAIKKLTDGRGADYAFECTSIPALSAAPLSMVRHSGMAVQVSGNEKELTIPMDLFEWDKIYINPLYGKCNPQKDFHKIFSLYQKGDLLLDEMITRTYPLEKLPQAFDDMHHGKNAKGVLVFD